jgi:hypothetical protein
MIFDEIFFKVLKINDDCFKINRWWERWEVHGQVMGMAGEMVGGMGVVGIVGIVGAVRVLRETQKDSEVRAARAICGSGGSSRRDSERIGKNSIIFFEFF